MEEGGEGGKEGDGRIGYYLRIQGFCPADWSYLFNCYKEEVSVLYIIISLHMKKKKPPIILVLTLQATLVTALAWGNIL